MVDLKLVTDHAYAMPVALEDAAHLYLSEDDVARILAKLIRDPSSGRIGDRFWTMTFRTGRGAEAVTAKYRWDLDEGRVSVYLLRLVAARRAPRNVKEAAGVVRKLAIGVLQKKLNTLLEVSDGK